MKNPQSVFVEDTLFVGGGYTESLTDSDIFSNRGSIESWITLPPLSYAPQLPAFVTFGKKLILLGGKGSGEKDDQHWGYKPTNKVSVWNLENRSWEFTLPPMTTPRVSPVAFTYGCYIIAAGGSRGTLDYQAELLDTTDSSCMHWVCGPSLPVAACHQNLSAVANGKWYLLDRILGDIFYVDVDAYIKQTLLMQSSSSEPLGKELKWEKVPHKPTSLGSTVVPFRITSFKSQLAALAETHGKPVMYLLQEDYTWLMVVGQLLPVTASSANLLSKDSEGSMLMLGGETSTGFSSKIYEVSITTQEMNEIRWGERVRVRRPTATVLEMWSK